MKIIFRADASREQGGGHVMRSLVVAGEFSKRGHDCLFVAQEGSYDLVPYKGTNDNLNKIEIDSKKTNDASALKSLLPQDFQPDLVFVDSYLLQEDYQEKLASFCKKVAVLDDMPVRKHKANILIDPTFTRRPAEYKDVMPGNSSILTGVRYAPLREDFVRHRPKSLARRGKSKSQARAVKHIVISFGLTDPDNITSEILKALAKVESPLECTAVLGKNSEHEKEVAQLCCSLKTPARLLIAHDDMPGLLAECDLVIGAGGSSSWERCCLGVPAFQVILAKNQEDVTNSLASVGAILSLGSSADLSPATVTDEVEKHLRDDLLLVTMSQSAALLCDGLGASRIAEQVETLLA